VEKYCTAGQATRDDITMLLRFAGWITKATNTHTEYLTLVALQLQQWLHENASILRHFPSCSVQQTHFPHNRRNINQLRISLFSFSKGFASATYMNINRYD